MASFTGGMREQADHRRMRLTVDSQGGRIEPSLWGRLQRAPTYVFAWSQVERIEPVLGRYLSGPGVRFVFREPVPALEGSPNAARWPAAKAPVFLCGSDSTYRAVMAAVPASLVSQAAPADQPPAAQAG